MTGGVGTEGRFAGLILAAGASRRMPGRSKLARAWSGTTVLGAVIECAGKAGLDPLFVAVSGNTPDIGSEHVVTTVQVPRPEAGRAESLAAGLSAMPAGAVIVLLGDEPGIRAADIRRLAAGWDEDAADMARIRYADRSGHPVLLGPPARSRAEQLSDDVPIWETLRRAGFAAVEIAVDGSAPIDVDSPDALRLARRQERVE